MSPLEDLSHSGVLFGQLQRGADIPLMPGEVRVSTSVKNHVGLIASHMVKQLKEHETALRNTQAIFEDVLNELQEIRGLFQEAFKARSVPVEQVYAHLDADRSVGILNIFWHTLSFVCRGNTKPLALYRNGRDPVFTGRIVALQGDFQQVALELDEPDYPGLLQYELASLYVPADTSAPAVMTIKHLGEEEQFFHQADASRMFLLKTLEMVCCGGLLHEKSH